MLAMAVDGCAGDHHASAGVGVQTWEFAAAAANGVGNLEETKIPGEEAVPAHDMKVLVEAVEAACCAAQNEMVGHTSSMIRWTIAESGCVTCTMRGHSFVYTVEAWVVPEQG